MVVRGCRVVRQTAQRTTRSLVRQLVSHWTMEPPGHKPLVVNVLFVGLFEEEEDGTGITSDVVKVKGKDLATPGYHLRSVDIKKSGDRNDSPISG